ncbi:hypothetical protein NUITMVS3_39380 [Shewanella xiamenensis]|jgi:hypothetical protein|nr:hypothetical protein NUITMVS2_27810 [Shewanella xiamenensis]GLD79504.1 hypothetical protein NUITMVS3_39380 [Shewanella xiamenensis]
MESMVNFKTKMSPIAVDDAGNIDLGQPNNRIREGYFPSEFLVSHYSMNVIDMVIFPHFNSDRA